MAAAARQTLGIKPGTTTLVVGMSTSGARDLIGELPEGAVVEDVGSTADLVIFFATSVDDVRQGAANAYAKTAVSGRCWVAYRKGASRTPAPASGEPALHRDTLQAALAEAGLDGVTLIALDDSWSAMRIKKVSASAPAPPA
jgi:hypothetical protein